MKKLAYLAIALVTVSCQPKSEPAEQVQEEAAPVMAYFGGEINEEGSISATEIPSKLEGLDSVRLKVTGTIEKVCQVKGCWMTMKINDDQSMHVSFKDYGFFVPKDIDGKEAVIEGYAYITTQSIDELKHYAEDEGKTQEEIDAITEPVTKLSFVADGVIVKGYKIADTAAETDEESVNHEHNHH